MQGSKYLIMAIIAENNYSVGFLFRQYVDKKRVNKKL